MRARRRTPVRPARGNRWRLTLRDAPLAAPDTLWRPIGRLGGPSLPSIAAWQSPVCTPRATGLEVSPEAASAHRQCGLVHDVPGPRVPCAELACGEPMRAHIGESGWPRVSPATPRFQRTHGGLTGSRSWASGADRLAAAPGVATRTPTRLPPTAPGRLPHRRPGARGSIAVRRSLRNAAVRWRVRGIPVETAGHPSADLVPGIPDHRARWPVPSRRAAACEGREAPAAWFRLPAAGRWGERADRALRPADSR
jgi:hypothetical protein